MNELRFPEVFTKFIASFKKHAKPIRFIANPPATIVFFDDGSKEVVKCMKEDTFDPAYGFLLACFYKAYPNVSKCELKKILAKITSSEEE